MKSKRERKHLHLAAGGTALVVLLSAAGCIFDKGDYKGGGRRDDGVETEAGTTTDEPDTSTPTPLPDVLVVGD